MAQWSRVLDIRLSDWRCSVSMVCVQIPSRDNKYLLAQKSNSNTVRLNLQTNICIKLVDFHMEINNAGRLTTRFYDKRDDFIFHIVNFSFISSNIPAVPDFTFHNSYIC